MHRSSVFLPGLFGVAAVAAVVTACSSTSTKQDTCSSDADCRNGESCIQQACTHSTATRPDRYGDAGSDPQQPEAGPEAAAPSCPNVTCGGACCAAGEVCRANACAPPEVDGGVCGAPGVSCTDTAQCCQTGTGLGTLGAVCISDDNSCHAKCTSGVECKSGCCAPVKGESYGVCAAASYCTTLASTGAHCTSGAQCASGDCAGGNGWCTTSCSPTNSVCAGGYGADRLYNVYGHFNWCLRNGSGSDTCFPGCNTSSDCAVFPGTTCRSFYDVNNHLVNVCST
jgi:hypothetical protein